MWIDSANRDGPMVWALLVVLLLAGCRPRSESTGESSKAVGSAAASSTPPASCAPVKRSVPAPNVPGECSCGPKVRGLDATIVQVHYSVRPEDGAAMRDVYPTGCVFGSHVGGGPHPTGGVEYGCVSADCVRGVWRLAAEVRDELARRQRPKEPTGANRVVSFTLRGDRHDGVSWPLSEAAPMGSLQRLSELMGAMDIGYW